jgi:23S rRNA (adenine2503-C2)-methyltransferase
MTKHPFILDQDFSSLETHLQSLGEPAFRAKQLWHGLYKQLWESASVFTTLSKELQAELDHSYTFTNLSTTKQVTSRDGYTIKTLFKTPDDHPVEAVLMRYKKRRTLCISTQSGCALGCVFCATGQLGLKRNLTSGEIVEQVLYYARTLKEEGERPTNIVFMGMGEPFHNYAATMEAVDRLNHPDGFKFGARRMTISTVGLVPMMKRFTEEKRQVNLAVSLHAADDDLRSSMMPINRKYPLEELMEACRDYVKKTGRRITFEWALIQGVNDSQEQAQRLIDLIQGLLCHVNIIPLNPISSYSGKATSRERVEAFQNILTASGIPCTIRVRRGVEIHAGCGQLAGLPNSPAT